MTPENDRSLLVMSKLCELRDWLTDEEGEIGMSRDSCIASTRMVMEVARYFALPRIMPIAVSTAVFNRLAFEEYQAWHSLSPEEQAVTPMQLVIDESWAVGIEGDDTNTGGRWNGHLIAQIQDLFVDFSLDQFSRPEHDMATTAAIFPIQNIWYEHGVAVYQREDGVAVVYRHMENAQNYRNAPDWTNFQRWRPVMGRLIKKLKEELA